MGVTGLPVAPGFPRTVSGGFGDDYFNIGRDPDRDVIDGGEGLDDNRRQPRDGDPEGGTEPAHIDLSLGTATTEKGARTTWSSIQSRASTAAGLAALDHRRRQGQRAVFRVQRRRTHRTGMMSCSRVDGGTEFYGGPGNDGGLTASANEETSLMAARARTRSRSMQGCADGRSGCRHCFGRGRIHLQHADIHREPPRRWSSRSPERRRSTCWTGASLAATTSSMGERVTTLCSDAGASISWTAETGPTGQTGEAARTVASTPKRSLRVVRSARSSLRAQRRGRR